MRQSGERNRNSGTVWLVCLKVLVVIFAIGLFSTAVWYRQHIYNPPLAGPVTDAGVAVANPAILETGDGGGEVPALAISGSKSLATLPMDYTFTQPSGPNPVTGEVALDADSIDALIAESVNVRDVRRIAAASSKSGMVIAPGDWKFTQAESIEGGHITIVESGAPPEGPKVEGQPDLLISSSKSIAMPIFTTRLPANSGENTIVPGFWIDAIPSTIRRPEPLPEGGLQDSNPLETETHFWSNFFRFLERGELPSEQTFWEESAGWDDSIWSR